MSALLVKQIGMSSGARCDKDELVFVYRVHKEPVRSDMAFAITDIPANERMVAVPFLKRLLCAKLIKHNLELIHVEPALLHPLVVAFELRGGDELERHVRLLV